MVYTIQETTVNTAYSAQGAVEHVEAGRGDEVRTLSASTLKQQVKLKI